MHQTRLRCATDHVLMFVAMPNPDRRVTQRWPQLHHEICVGAGEHSWVVHGDVVKTLDNTPDGFTVCLAIPSPWCDLACLPRVSSCVAQEVPEASFRLLPDFSQRRGPVGIQQVGQWAWHAATKLSLA